MQIKSLLVTLVAGALAFASCNTFKSSKVELKTVADSVAYAIGTDIGTNVSKSLESAPGNKDLNKDIIIKAFENAFNGKESSITTEQAQAIIQSYFMKKQAEEIAKNLEEGKKFLDENAKKSGIKTTASGLQYEVIKEGTGPKPVVTDSVKVDYHGTTLDGKVFDSSVDRKQPATFVVNQVIAGWTEALQLMSVGSKYKLYIPSGLAYGEQGAGQNIKPNSVLVFEVELLEIKK